MGCAMGTSSAVRSLLVIVVPRESTIVVDNFNLRCLGCYRLWVLYLAASSRSFNAGVQGGENYRSADRNRRQRYDKNVRAGSTGMPY